jgi:hypothetical protein
MRPFFVLFLLVLVLLMIFSWQKYRRNQALKIVQNVSKKVTDEAFLHCIKQLKFSEYDGSKVINEIASEYIADVWGKGILAFEYSIDAQKITTTQLPLIKEELTQLLNEYAKNKKLPVLKDQPVFCISDIWLFADVLHIDIAHVANQQTLGYLQDIKKLEE